MGSCLGCERSSKHVKGDGPEGRTVGEGCAQHHRRRSKEGAARTSADSHGNNKMSNISATTIAAAANTDGRNEAPSAAGQEGEDTARQSMGNPMDRVASCHQPEGPAVVAAPIGDDDSPCSPAYSPCNTTAVPTATPATGAAAIDDVVVGSSGNPPISRVYQPPPRTASGVGAVGHHHHHHHHRPRGGIVMGDNYIGACEGGLHIMSNNNNPQQQLIGNNNTTADPAAAGVDADGADSSSHLIKPSTVSTVSVSELSGYRPTTATDDGEGPHVEGVPRGTARGQADGALGGANTATAESGRGSLMPLLGALNTGMNTHPSVQHQQQQHDVLRSSGFSESHEQYPAAEGEGGPQTLLSTLTTTSAKDVADISTSHNQLHHSATNGPSSTNHTAMNPTGGCTDTPNRSTPGHAPTALATDGMRIASVPSVAEDAAATALPTAMMMHHPQLAQMASQQDSPIAPDESPQPCAQMDNSDPLLHGPANEGEALAAPPNPNDPPMPTAATPSTTIKSSTAGGKKSAFGGGGGLLAIVHKGWSIMTKSRDSTANLNESTVGTAAHTNNNNNNNNSLGDDVGSARFSGGDTLLGSTEPGRAALEGGLGDAVAAHPGLRGKPAVAAVPAGANTHEEGGGGAKLPKGAAAVTDNKIKKAAPHNDHPKTSAAAPAPTASDQSIPPPPIPITREALIAYGLANADRREDGTIAEGPSKGGKEGGEEEASLTVECLLALVAEQHIKVDILNATTLCNQIVTQKAYLESLLADPNAFSDTAGPHIAPDQRANLPIRASVLPMLDSVFQQEAMARQQLAGVTEALRKHRWEYSRIYAGGVGRLGVGEPAVDWKGLANNSVTAAPQPKQNSTSAAPTPNPKAALLTKNILDLIDTKYTKGPNPTYKVAPDDMFALAVTAANQKMLQASAANVSAWVDGVVGGGMPTAVPTEVLLGHSRRQKSAKRAAPRGASGK